MSNTYAQISDTLLMHGKTTECCGILEISRYQLIGHLAALWNWALKNHADGNFGRLKPRHISNAAGWTNADQFGKAADEQAAVFVQALVDCADEEGGAGFLEKDEDGNLFLHNWHFYGGKVDEKTKRNAFHQFLSRKRSEGIDILPSDENFNRWKTDKEALVESHKNPGKKQSDLPKSDTKTPVSSRKSDVSLTYASSIAEQRTAEQSRDEHSEEQQQQSREESMRGETVRLTDETLPVPSGPADAAEFAKQREGERDSVPDMLPPSSLAEANPDLVRQLIAADVNRADAVRLARDFAEECTRQLAFLPYVERFTKGRGAYLAAAIRDGYGPPVGYDAAVARQEASEATQRNNDARKASAGQQSAKNAAVEAATEAVKAIPDLWRKVEEEALSLFPPEIQKKSPESTMYQATLRSQIRRIIERDYLDKNCGDGPLVINLPEEVA